MNQRANAKNQLISRVKTWCGVGIKDEGSLTKILLRDRVVARFPSEESIEVSLCGSIKKQAIEEPESLPAGVWAECENKVMLIDLTQPGGMEEAFRALMNCYIAAESQLVREWWMCEKHMHEDPTCERIAEVLKENRAKLATG